MSTKKVVIRPGDSILLSRDDNKRLLWRVAPYLAMLDALTLFSISSNADTDAKQFYYERLKRMSRESHHIVIRELWRDFENILGVEFSEPRYKMGFDYYYEQRLLTFKLRTDEQ